LSASSFFGLRRGRPRLRLTAGDRVEHLLEGYAVVHVRSGQDEGERDALAIRDEVGFRAWATAIGRVRPDRGTPSFCRDGRIVHRDSGPVNAIGVLQSAEQCTVQPLPDARRLPFAQALPAGQP